jgi:hypothetical protein
VSNPSTNNQDLPRVEASGCVAHTRKIHFTSGLEFFGNGIVQFSRLVKFLVPTHATNNENPTIW